MALDNLRLRSAPDINSENVIHNYYMTWDFELDFESNLFYKNDLAAFDAKTVKLDTIDGITAPWYRVYFIFDFIREYYWGFGGYLKEMPVENYSEEAKNAYYKMLKENNLIKKRL